MTARKTAARRVTAALAAAAVAFSGAVLLAPSASAASTVTPPTSPVSVAAGSSENVTVSAVEDSLTSSGTTPVTLPVTAPTGVTVSVGTAAVTTPSSGVTVTTPAAIGGGNLTYTLTDAASNGTATVSLPLTVTAAASAASGNVQVGGVTVATVTAAAPPVSGVVAVEDVKTVANDVSSVAVSNVSYTPIGALGATVTVSLDGGAKFVSVPSVQIGSTNVTARELNAARDVLTITVPSSLQGTSQTVRLSNVRVNTNDAVLTNGFVDVNVTIGGAAPVHYFTVSDASLSLSATTIASTSATAAIPTYSGTGNITLTLANDLTVPAGGSFTVDFEHGTAGAKVDVVGTSSSITVRGTGSTVLTNSGSDVEWSTANITDSITFAVPAGVTTLAKGTYVIRGIQIAATPGKVEVSASVAGQTVTASNEITASAAGDDRIAGADRYATSARIAVAYWATAGAGQDTVVIANGEQARGGADALAASYLAAQVEAPVLLVEKDFVPSSVLVALLAQTNSANAKFTTVYVLGDTNAVSASAVDALVASGVVEAIDVERVSGADRFATSAAVATAGEVEGEIGTVETSATSGVQTAAFLANGWSSADALVAGPIANAKDLPVLLTDGTTLSTAVRNAIDNLDIERVIVLGNTTAVSAEVVTALEALDVDVTRIGGATRFDTAADLNKLALTGESSYGLGLAAGTVYLTDGFGFADALAVSPLAGLTGQLVVPTWSSELAGASKTFLTDNKDKIETVTALGGTDRVASDVLAAAVAAAR